MNPAGDAERRDEEGTREQMGGTARRAAEERSPGMSFVAQ